MGIRRGRATGAAKIAFAAAVAMGTVTMGLALPPTPGAAQRKQTAGQEAQAAAWPTRGWPGGKPADVGLDAKVIEAFDADIRAAKYGYVDSMLVIRCGRAVYESTYQHDYERIYGEEARAVGPLNHDPRGEYNYFSAEWHPFYKRGALHSMQSVTKSVMSVTIGVARTRGEFPELGTPILKFFDTSKIAHVDERKRRITIRHLLTMSAGMDFNEDLPYTDPNNAATLMEASRDWVQFAMDRPMNGEPGTVFAYSSGASQILSHIFKQATGRDIQDYAREHLFAPLGIREFYWKRTPTGLTDTEGGLYLRAQDLAKIGFLFLNGGRWDGKQVVSADWVKESVTPSIAVDGGPVQYGFQWWLPPYGDTPGQYVWAAHGFGGQRLFVLPEREMILVFTGWNLLTPPLNAREAINRMVAAIQQPACGHP